jgi:hypothetical protein
MAMRSTPFKNNHKNRMNSSSSGVHIGIGPGGGYTPSVLNMGSKQHSTINLVPKMAPHTKRTIKTKVQEMKEENIGFDETIVEAA